MNPDPEPEELEELIYGVYAPLRMHSYLLSEDVEFRVDDLPRSLPQIINEIPEWIIDES